MYKHILVPIAFDHVYDDFDPLKVAEALAGADSRISMLHVMEAIPAYAISYLTEDYREESREAIRVELQGRCKDMPQVEVHVIDGHSGRTILEWAEEQEVDLIVMPSHRPGLSDYFLGSTASRVVRHAQCSVHVMR